MATWATLSGLNGYYTSENISISISGDGALTQIKWDAYQPIGTKVSVQTSVSENGGYDWTDWQFCVNGGNIPDVKTSHNIGSFLVRYRIFLFAESYESLPRVDNIELYFESVIAIENKGVSKCTPEIWITKDGQGDFALVNTSNGNEEFKIRGLQNNETVYVNNETKFIETDLAVTYRYKDFNGNYMNLPYGLNIFKVHGDGQVRIRFEFKL